MLQRLLVRAWRALQQSREHRRAGGLESDESRRVYAFASNRGPSSDLA
jgi:hypothetical protein